MIKYSLSLTPARNGVKMMKVNWFSGQSELLQSMKRVQGIA